MPLLLLSALLLSCLLTGQQAQALILEGDTLWQGEKELAESVIVPRGVTLTVAAGSRIVFAAGGLEVAGVLQAQDAEFSGNGWPGIELKGASEATRLSGGRISGAKTALLVRGGAPRISGVTFSGNKVGVELRSKSAAQLRDCRFVDNTRVGLFVKDESVAVIEGCTFERNGRFGAYVYRARPARFGDNRFWANPVGLMVAYYGSDPVIEGNRFEGNDVGIEVDRAARPELRGNRVVANRVGMRFTRRSDPLASGNLIDGNETGILVTYSSYPRISGNDFTANQVALKLAYQSSQWEQQEGAAARAGEVSGRAAFAGRGARSVTEEERRGRNLDGSVDARNNWWGEAETKALAAGGAEHNPASIHDGRDQASFVDAGRSYPMDRVLFAPWSGRPLTELKR
jgi:parallel beta-helix repeat protein